jgi:hypothetical protein
MKGGSFKAFDFEAATQCYIVIPAKALIQKRLRIGFLPIRPRSAQALRRNDIRYFPTMADRRVDQAGDSASASSWM